MAMHKLLKIGMLGIAILFSGLCLPGCGSARYDDIEVTSSLREGGKVSVRCDNARVEDVVRKVAEQAGYEVHVEGRSLNGARCTISLQDVDPIKALQSVVESHGCWVLTSRAEGMARIKVMPEE